MLFLSTSLDSVKEIEPTGRQEEALSCKPAGTDTLKNKYTCFSLEGLPNDAAVKIDLPEGYSHIGVTVGNLKCRMARLTTHMKSGRQPSKCLA